MSPPVPAFAVRLPSTLIALPVSALTESPALAVAGHGRTAARIVLALGTCAEEESRMW